MRHAKARKVRRAIGIGGAITAVVLLAVGGGVVLGHNTPTPAQAADPNPVPDQATTTGRSEASAIRAAIDHLEALNGPDWYEGEARDRLLETIADPKELDRLAVYQDQGAAIVDENTGLVTAATSGTPLVARWAPMGYRVQTYSGDYAAVAVWGVTVIGTAEGSYPHTAWATTTAVERWVDGEWKLSDLRTVRGPIPVPDDADPTPAGDMVPAVLDLQEPTYAP